MSPFDELVSQVATLVREVELIRVYQQRVQAKLDSNEKLLKRILASQKAK